MKRLKVRRPAVAGSFYPGTRKELLGLLSYLFSSLGIEGIPPPREDGVRKVKSLLSPHAGYIYSGRTAAAGYSKLAEDGIPETFVILGPNHTGLGAAFSVSSADSWETPLGEVELDKELISAIQKHFSDLSFDDLAHMSEHSVEVQIPFLQAIFGNRFKIVPIVMGVQTPESAISLGEAISIASEELKRDIVVIASSDMSHYIPEEEARKKDQAALQSIMALDVHGLFNVIYELDISMCGPGPASVAMTHAKMKGVKRGELVRYSTSAEASGDKSLVVGYASVVFRE